MESIRAQYQWLLATLLGVAITAQSLSSSWLLAHADSAQGTVYFLLKSSALYTSIVLIPLAAYRYWVWKWFNKRRDISGEWGYELSGSHYGIDVVTDAGGVTRVQMRHLGKISPRRGRVVVDQTPFTLSFHSGSETETDGASPGVSADWHSTSASLEGERAHISYIGHQGSVERRGTETFVITCEDNSPVRMSSKIISHAIDSNTNQATVYIASGVYTRCEAEWFASLRRWWRKHFGRAGTPRPPAPPAAGQSS